MEHGEYLIISFPSRLVACALQETFNKNRLKKKVNWAEKSLHPLLITAAHSGVSIPWITAQSWSECSPLPANISKCVWAYSMQYNTSFVYHSMAHWRRWQSLQAVFWQEATLPASLLGPLVKHAGSALRHWGAMESRADSEPSGPQQQIKDGVEGWRWCDDGCFKCRGGRKVVSFGVELVPQF